MVAVRVKVCSIVVCLGFLALLSGVVAEVTRMQMNNVKFSDLGVYTCSYPKQVATLPLGIFAALCVLVSQIVANAFGGCVCCCARTKNLASEGRKTAAILFLMFSWIVSIVSLVWLLLFGLANVLTSSSSMVTQQNCPTPFPGGLITGGILAMVGAFLAVMFCLLATSKPNPAEIMPVTTPTATPVTHPHNWGGAGPQTEVRMPVAMVPATAVPPHHVAGAIAPTSHVATKHKDSPMRKK